MSIRDVLRFCYDTVTIYKLYWEIRPLLGHYFQNKCSSESSCCIGSTFGVPGIPTVDSMKRTASKKLRRGDPDFLTLWLEKLLVKVYYHHHQPVDHQSPAVLTCHFFTTPGACAFAMGGVVTRFPLLLFPSLFSLSRIPE